jgi:VCBS repeat protein
MTGSKTRCLIGALLLAISSVGLARAVNLAGVELPKAPFGARGLERMKYNNPGLVVDLGVGLWAWPLPMDYDGDGDLDLVVSCADKPFNATCFFENPGGDAKMPVFKPPVVIGPGLRNCQIAHIHGQPRVTIPGYECVNFLKAGFDDRVKLPVEPKVHPTKIRANQWKYVDYDGDGRLDLVVGVGDWTDYGWDNAFTAKGEWTNGPLRGFVYLLRNTGSNEEPKYGKPTKIEVGGQPLEVYGMPSPNLADFDGDGDLDIICGEFIDKFTWFENVGTRKEPKYAAGKYLSRQGTPLRMDLCMIVPVAVDWDSDGDVDLVVGQEDGRVALVDNTGRMGDNGPVFDPPKFFRQEADEVKFGALVTPVSFDWDADGDEDLICGNTAGYIGLIENLDGGNPPKWAEAVLLEADGQVLRIEAGSNGSIQGPCETKWGYTTLSVADWDHDGLADLLVNSIWGKVVWYRNVGQKGRPKLAAPAPIEVQWQGPPPKPAWNWWEPDGNGLATQWRTTPVAHDLTGDGLVDLVMLDPEGYLALFERKRADGRLLLLPPKRVFRGANAAAFDRRHAARGKAGDLLRLSGGKAGGSGRRKLCLADWDLDGKIDILVNSRSIDFLKNVSTDEGTYAFANTGPVDSRVLAGHTTSPTVVDWDRDGSCDLLVGAEDGFFYYLKNPHDKAK